MHISVNKCELLAEQIVTDVPLRKVKLKIKKDFNFTNTIGNEYTFLQNLYHIEKDTIKKDGTWNEDSIFWLRDLIAYILWYENNVKNSPAEAMEYAKQIVNRKWTEREDLAYV